MSEFTQLWLKAFLWTLALETPIYLLWLRSRFEAWWAPLVVSLVAQVTTHPALWFIVPEIFPQCGIDGECRPYWQWVLVCELGVTAVEVAVVYIALRGRLTALRALGLAAATSVTANLFSTLVGLWML